MQKSAASKVNKQPAKEKTVGFVFQLTDWLAEGVGGVFSA